VSPARNHPGHENRNHRRPCNGRQSLASSQAIGLLGICIALLGALVNWYYKREANRRFAAEHALRQQERQIRIDMMRATGRPVLHDTDLGALEADE